MSLCTEQFETSKNFPWSEKYESALIDIASVSITSLDAPAIVSLKCQFVSFKGSFGGHVPGKLISNALRLVRFDKEPHTLP